MTDATALATRPEETEQKATTRLLSTDDQKVVESLRADHADWQNAVVPVSAILARVDELFPQASGQKCGPAKGYRIQKLISPDLFSGAETGSQNRKAARPEPRTQKPAEQNRRPEPRKVPAEPAPEVLAAAAPEAVEVSAEVLPELDQKSARNSGPRGALISWTAFLFGGVMSIAANVAHAAYPTGPQLATWIEAGNSAATWRPELGAMITAAFWPIGLVLAIEVLTRVEWHPGNWFSLARFVGLSIVALVAAVMSYRHMADLLGIWGEDQFGRHLGPLAVDGLMLIAATALLSISKTRRKALTREIN